MKDEKTAIRELFQMMESLIGAVIEQQTQKDGQICPPTMEELRKNMRIARDMGRYWQ